MELLNIKNLKTYFYTDRGVARAVDGIDLTTHKGNVLGVVGESGCGKSVMALSVLRLIPFPPGKIESGEIIFDGKDLLKLKENEMRKVRGNRISMIFQEPMTSLNPVFKVGDQISEAIRLHQGLSKKEAFEKSIEMLESVRIPSPQKLVHQYPHQISGGMRQRVMIAMALSCHPSLMIADEPTTALDVTIQAQILYLMQDLRDKFGTSIILITHDQSVIAENAQEVIVMYAGKVMEFAEVIDLFDNPCHPYTIGLMKAIPKPGDTRMRLDIIPGIVPSLYNFHEGCKFSDRCDQANHRCVEEEAPLFEVKPKHLCRCWLYK
jgi:peptide/nickel transport system ATP-binding protein/oligopeptide transport system ATP-binding protein